MMTLGVRKRGCPGSNPCAGVNSLNRPVKTLAMTWLEIQDWDYALHLGAYPWVPWIQDPEGKEVGDLACVDLRVPSFRGVPYCRVDPPSYGPY